MIDTPIWVNIGLTLLYLNPKSSNFCNLNYHYLYIKLIDIRAEDLSPRVLTAESILEVYQYNFDMENLTFTPKNVKLPKNDKYFCGIEDLKKTPTPSR